MLQKSSDAAEDFGRMESERQIRNKPTSRWLDDVVKQADGDHDEISAIIEGQKDAANEMHNNFLASLDSALHVRDTAKTVDRKRQVEDLLANADMMLKIYKHANNQIDSTFNGANSPANIQENHEADVQRVKDVLLVGKRICAGELEEVEQHATAKELLGRKEVSEQAAGIFGGPKKGDGGNESVDRTLAYVERGVRRMVKGME